MCSGGESGAIGDTCFLLYNKYTAAILNFMSINERIRTLRMKACFFKITFVCVYAPTEDAEDEEKDLFYGQLEMDSIPRQDVEIVHIRELQ
jgi:hypothetical protein